MVRQVLFKCLGTSLASTDRRARGAQAPEVGHSGGVGAKMPEQLSQRSPQASREGCVSLNVGGKQFVVPVETLRGDRHPDESVRSSVLAAMVSGRWRGPLKIDRLPGAFPFVLEYLQCHKLFNYPENIEDFSKLEGDADFFGLSDLRRTLHVRLGTYFSCSSTANGLW
eukprot:CAMPEP_0179113816 /NCGR_PEP_ID=MMETSP0796-20121207/53266_1 /TAXON_ID=73915 /ORGANISM="Pyrodinium bahamense, Strain pbaha01" /LENGTH=167 /DNA_ID=CAMNT_0020812021 /DNA_START=1 /DNA_END=501 /DNA_ORIENTATION=+